MNTQKVMITKVMNTQKPTEKKARPVKKASTLLEDMASATTITFPEPYRNPGGTYKRPRPCKLCGTQIPCRVFFDGKPHQLASRSYCLKCSPLGANRPRKLAKQAEEARTETKFCHGCGVAKPFADFQASTTSGLQSQCRACHARLYADSITAFIERGLRVFGNACVACGYKGCADAMVIVDPNGKSYVGWALKDIGYAEIPRALKGGVTMCARCDVERRTGMLTCTEFGGWTVGEFEPKAKTLKEMRGYALHPDRLWRTKSGVMHMAITHKGGHCAVCAYSRCEDAMELHLEGGDFIATAHYDKTWEAIKRGIARHTLLCVRCHAEVDRGYTELSPSGEIDLTGSEFFGDTDPRLSFGQAVGAAWTLG